MNQNHYKINIDYNDQKTGKNQVIQANGFIKIIKEIVIIKTIKNNHKSTLSQTYFFTKSN